MSTETKRFTIREARKVNNKAAKLLEANFVQEERKPSDPRPSCHACGYWMMVPSKWDERGEPTEYECFQCGATTGCS